MRFSFNSQLFVILLAAMVIVSQSQVKNFDFEFFNQIISTNSLQNTIISPYSAKIALSMALEGAKGQTQSQIISTCNLPTNQLQRLQNTLANLKVYNQLNANKNSSSLKVANSMWTSTQLAPPLDSFSSLIKKYYLAQAAAVDFENQAQAVGTINDWISKNTDQLIQNVLQPSDVDANTYMVLVNAIVFKGIWQNAFNKSLTTSEQFNVALSSSQSQFKQVQMMHMPKTKFNYYSDSNVQMVELPYYTSSASSKTNQFVIDLILPNEASNNNLNQIVSQLSQNFFQTYVQNMYSQKLNVNLPKFSFKQQNSLNSYLQNMGISDAFNQNLADFSGIDGTDDLYISHVIQQAMIEVDEAGTTAAAATVKMIERVVTVSFDHPFIFIIRNVQTNDILFIGQVVDPTQN